MTDSAELPAEARAVLDFGFGAPGSAEHGTQRELWFTKREATDRTIAARFGPLVERALRGELEAWAARPGSALAEIVLLDQFTRNAFRDTPRAFAGDARALHLATLMVAAGTDALLPPLQRTFAYLPFEHAERAAMQDEAVRLFARLVGAAPELSEMLEYAEKHRAVVQRFGRFPHRNALLGRQSTPSEIQFLREPGSRF